MGWLMVGEPRYRDNPSYNVGQFFEYLHNNGRSVPFRTNEIRWNAMLKWLSTREELKDWITNEKGNKE